MLQRRRFAALTALVLPGFSIAQGSTDAALAQRLRAGRCAVLWRHAQTTAGIGDPPGFRLETCSTQRNLSDAGRAQARATGAWFKSQGLKPAAVRSSAWCRCKDTADLAFGGHELWQPLDSTFGEGRDAAGQQALRDRLKTIPAGAFEVWVTHQVNITALTEVVPAMGEVLIVDAAGQVVGRGNPRA